VGRRVGKIKNTSCNELEDVKASRGELRSLPLPGEPGSYICRWLPGPWVASYGLRVQTRLAIPFSTTAEPYSMRFAQLAMGCSNPGIGLECVGIVRLLLTILNTEHASNPPAPHIPYPAIPQTKQYRICAPD